MQILPHRATLQQSFFLALLVLSVTIPFAAATRSHVEHDTSLKPTQVVVDPPTKVLCDGANISRIPCCCHPPCSANGSGCLSFLFPPDREGGAPPTEAHFMSVDGSGHKYCCGENCPQSNCLLFLRDFLLALEGPLQAQLHNKLTGKMPHGTDPACGPNEHPASCLTFILRQIELLPHPVNLTVSRWGNFTSDGEAKVDL